jgi:hypothetical protein
MEFTEAATKNVPKVSTSMVYGLPLKLSIAFSAVMTLVTIGLSVALAVEKTNNNNNVSSHHVTNVTNNNCSIPQASSVVNRNITINSTLIISYNAFYWSLPANKSINVSWFFGQTGYQELLLATTTTPSINFTYATFPGLGAYITTIDGYGDDSINYWQLFFNGIYSEVGLSSLIVNPSDRITWVLTPY